MTTNNAKTSGVFPSLPAILVEEGVRAALKEDLGRAGDLTTDATIGPELRAQVSLVSREAGSLCGVDFARTSFALAGAGLQFEAFRKDGDTLAPGDEIARVTGNARAILSSERVALNYLCHLSGVASTTAKFADLIAHTDARICCTRKTTPGLRAYEKYAVRCGGGANHRFGLDDAVLIKDNHIAVCGSITKAIEAARNYVGHLVVIEIEVDTLEQLEEALSAGATTILVDNFGIDGLKEAVKLNNGRARIEASGGINIDTIKDVAETGVDFISSSKITISAPTLDIGLDVTLG
ncbi:carboxylating nicotinate-nucleotide diphosphorylase [Thalassospira sp. GO-4]|jgi:nicotinate-nucleotide pyrophosphorylase (carboxylating)|uniref:carboxylating nicotinate-nucleotide diphosphorylase n=1 Tax=unclassified Thalassospira TaxID=2648997 RepID=UPI001B2998C2|nr:MULTISPECIES: carboxylating nicotinate-nucleotide diphosphorylase [unclassified Thalassospira]MBO6773540.1 carboxylating nicotinate-nucleotide diphosphorylase [Thalassospira sp.]MBR9899500.1 carboxylating nicotinate-nucleotide diphosphorylase [Rhodospirillales bacterium]URK17498.1 carboxylating nicotinate-nucleotide diphosphorylase [Thalassospira sp. GO-4]